MRPVLWIDFVLQKVLVAHPVYFFEMLENVFMLLLMRP
jgi:hypothetical protein